MPKTVVAAPSDFAAAVGGQVAEAGGSAVDVLIASTLTAMCTEPGVCAPGGGGFLTVWPGDDRPVSIDGYMAMPSGTAEAGSVRRVEMEYGGGTITDVGAGTVAVPGGFAAFSAAHSRWGVMPWDHLMTVIADALAGGFPLSTSSHHYLQFSGEPIFGVDPVSRSALFESERLKVAGEMVRVDGLVDSLRILADEGAAAFYRGDLAKEICDDLMERGGAVRRADFENYRAIVASPTTMTLGKFEIATTPPPAIGGVVLATLLFHQMRSRSPESPQVWLEAQERAFEVRRDDLEPAQDPTQAGNAALAALTPSGSTVSIAVADSDGDVCAATMSGGYGSGVIPGGTGLWMNNSLGELELIQGPGAPAAGQRLMSNMAPTVITDGNRRIALGSPGADRITSALSTTITLLSSGHPLAAAIEHPRLHLDLPTSTVALEPGLDIDPGVHSIRRFAAKAMYFGGVTAAQLERGDVVAHADSRRTGGVLVIDRARKQSQS